MSNINLSGPEFSPISRNTPKNLVVFLHGYGADGNDLIGLAPVLAEHLPDTHFISPNAPEPCEMSPFGKQWFSLKDWSPENLLKGSKAAAPALDLFLDSQLSRFGLSDENLAFVGFSQGTMMSLFTALRRIKPCAAVVGFSGALIGEDGITSKPPVCLIHGDSDNVVPFGAMGLAATILQKEGIKVETHARAGLGHGIDNEGLNIATSFLKSRL
ncbi:MAG: prolyl oligopeptidase family serine peptidase [Pseudomonadota bacterium]